jgi:hypothetical protein
MLAEHESNHPRDSAISVAQALCDARIPTGDVEHTEKIIVHMKSMGSYYRNLEKELGPGSTLSLGINIPDST